MSSGQVPVSVGARLALARELDARSEEFDELRFPRGSIGLLKASGLTALTVPSEFGGPGASLRELVDAVVAVGEADAAVGFILAMHYIHSSRIFALQQHPLREQLAAAALQSGILIGGLVSERRRGAPHRGVVLQTTATRSEGGWLLEGVKTYATGSPGLDGASVAAIDTGNGARRSFYVPFDVPGVRIEATWDAIGLHGVGNHDVHFEGVRLGPEALLDAEGDGSSGGGPGAIWSLLFAASYHAQASRAVDLLAVEPRFPPRRPVPELELHQERHIRWAGQASARLHTDRLLLHGAVLSAQESGLDPQDAAAVKNRIHASSSTVISTVGEALGTYSLLNEGVWPRLYRDIRVGLHNAPPEDVVVETLGRRLLGVEPD